MLWALSALTLLVGRQEELSPVRNWVIWCLNGYLCGWRCKWSAYSSADVTAAPSCLASLTFLMLAYPGCPGKEDVKPMSVCLSYFMCKSILKLGILSFTLILHTLIYVFFCTCRDVIWLHRHLWCVWLHHQPVYVCFICSMNPLWS